MAVTVIEWAVATRPPWTESYAPRLRVVNGRVDDKNLYPFVVTLETEKSQIPKLPVFRVCTGSVVANQWVLTAAHCLHSLVTRVRYGDVTTPRDETKAISKVLKRIPHPAYHLGTAAVRNDIGLVLIEEIPIDSLGIIHTGDYKTFVGRACLFAGFGFTHANPMKIKAKEMVADLKRSLQVGEGLVRGSSSFLEGFLGHPRMVVVPKCVKRQWANSGDSGGPLIIDKKIVGVCSTGTKHTETRYTFSFYTPVSPFIDWIKQNIDDTNLLENV